MKAYSAMDALLKNIYNYNCLYEIWSSVGQENEGNIYNIYVVC